MKPPHEFVNRGVTFIPSGFIFSVTWVIVEKSEQPVEIAHHETMALGTLVTLAVSTVSHVPDSTVVTEPLANNMSMC